MNAPVMLCPCCGQPVPRGQVQSLSSIDLSPQQRAIVDALASHPGEWVPVPKLINAVYADDIDGGPLDAARVVTVQVCRMRHQLRGAGFVIEASHGGRRGGSHRRLVKVSA